jgi:uncharacterized LabA/DUF88 family protein
MKNIAFIDGQNLYLGTKEEGWEVDFKKFRIFLKDKYKVNEAYYFIGYLDDANQDLYDMLQKSGFIVQFKKHHGKLISQKKGNVDTDVVFGMMRSVMEEEFDKILLVSGDGDYKKIVDYLIKKNKLEKILFPNRKFASSLYKKLQPKYYDYLSSVKRKIRLVRNKKKRSP